MTRETKVGLLVGMGVILLVGIILSDQFALMEQQQQRGPGNFADQAQDGIGSGIGSGIDSRRGTGNDRAMAGRDGESPATPDQAAQRTTPGPVPTREEIDREQAPSGSEREQDQPRIVRRDYPDQVMVLDSNGQASYRDGTSVTEPPRLLRRMDEAEGEREQRSTGRAPRILREDDNRQHDDRQHDNDTTRNGGERAPTYHTVQTGETLYDIAKHYLDDGKQWRLIRDHNQDKVGEKGRVRAGVTLIIPVPGRTDQRDHTALQQLTRRANEALAGESQQQPARTRESAQPSTITVEQGDTLSTLASEHLGSAKHWRKLWDANRDKIDDPDRVPQGLTLTLPSDVPNGSSRSATTRRDAVTPPALSERNIYIVQQGDNLSKIAEQELGDRSRWQELYQANQDKLENPDNVPQGTALRLPS